MLLKWSFQQKELKRCAYGGHVCMYVWSAVGGCTYVLCVCTPVYTCSGVYVHIWGVHVWVGVHTCVHVCVHDVIFQNAKPVFVVLFFFSFQGIFKIKGTDCCGAEIFQV